MKVDIAARLENVTKLYGEVVALDSLTFNIKKGEIFGLLGPNGAGKTTTIQALLGLTQTNGGEAYVFGYDPLREAHLIRALTGVVMQQTALDAYLTGRENLLLQAALYNLPKAERQARVKEALIWAQLDEVGDRLVVTYSGGMKRRLDLALGILHNPSLFILDEPTLGLDIQTRKDLWSLIRKMKEAGTTIILTTHYLEEANQLCDRIGIISEGKLVALGTPAELRANVVSDSCRMQIQFKSEPKIPRLPVEVVMQTKGSDVLIRGPERAIWESLSLLISEQPELLSEVNFSQPTLDDVFLELTTSPLTKDNNILQGDL